MISYISIQEYSKLKWKIIFDAEHITEKSLQHRYRQVVVHLAILLLADGVELIILKHPQMRKCEVELHKYVAVGFLLYQYKNILNSNGTSSLPHNSLHAKSLEIAIN